MKEDYYNILGVSKDASDKEIKSAFRSLCKKYHPDKWTGKSETERKKAEEKFKQIAEAYSVLSDSEKRKQYDTFGTVGDNGNGGWSGGSAEDIMREFMSNRFNGFSDFGFSGFNGGYGKKRYKGDDKKIKISVTIEDVYFNKIKNVSYSLGKKCCECNGNGSKSGEKISCSNCNGTGFVTITKSFAGGYSQHIAPCPHCNGNGYIIKDPCKKCNGTGVINETVNSSFKVPNIDKLGLTYKIRSEGNACHNNLGSNGDLYIKFALRDEPDGKFHIDKENYLNIDTSIDISVIDCLTGCNKTIEAIDGSKLKLAIPQGTKDGYTHIFKGLGFHSSNGINGDLIVKINMTMPKLNKEQINKIKEIIK